MPCIRSESSLGLSLVCPVPPMYTGVPCFQSSLVPPLPAGRGSKMTLWDALSSLEETVKGLCSYKGQWAIPFRNCLTA